LYQVRLFQISWTLVKAFGRNYENTQNPAAILKHEKNFKILKTTSLPLCTKYVYSKFHEHWSRHLVVITKTPKTRPPFWNGKKIKKSFTSIVSPLYQVRWFLISWKLVSAFRSYCEKLKTRPPFWNLGEIKKFLHINRSLLVPSTLIPNFMKIGPGIWPYLRKTPINGRHFETGNNKKNSCIYIDPPLDKVRWFQILWKLVQAFGHICEKHKKMAAILKRERIKKILAHT
jgi:hypothetical protein